MKKMMSMVLLLTMVLLLLPPVERSVFAEYSYKTEGRFTYYVLNGEAVLKKCANPPEPTDLIIPDELGGYPVTKIAMHVLSECVNARNIVLPKQLKVIEKYAFESRKLESVTFPEGLTTIGNYAFRGSTIKEIILPDSVTTIGRGAFNDCTAEKIVIPKGVTVLEDGVFANNNITEIIIPENITTINSGVFLGNESLKKIYIPANVSSISGNIFQRCPNLEAIIVDSGNRYYSSEDGALIDKRNGILLCYPALREGKSYTVPIGVKTIAAEAFKSNLHLEEIILPNSVKKIEDGAFQMISLKRVFLGDGVTEVGKAVFKFCDNLEYVWLGSSIPVLTEEMFYRCLSLKHIAIPSSVQKIEAKAFCATGLESLTIGDGVEIIAGNSFSDCNSLKTVVFGEKMTEISGGWSSVEKMIIPTSVKKIDGSFNSPLNLEIYYKGSLSEWLDIEISSYSTYQIQNATKYYDYTGENERVKASSVTCSSENERTTVTVQFESVSWDCTAYVCVYDVDGKMLKAVSGKVAEGDTELQLMIPEEFPNGSKVKVFFWENMISMNPYGVPIETTIS